MKILFGKALDKDTAHWEAERSQLLPKTRVNSPSWIEHWLDLAAVNAILWHAEDDLREARTLQQTDEDWAEWGDVARLAFRIQALNDKRAELIGLINSAAGDERGMDK